MAQELSDCTPAVRIQHDVEMVAAGDADDLLLPSPRIDQPQRVRMRDHGIPFGHQDQDRRLGGLRQAQRIESMTQQKPDGAPGETTPRDLHDRIVRCDQNGGSNWPTRCHVGRDSSSETSADHRHAVPVHPRLRNQPVVELQRVRKQRRLGRTPLGSAVASIVDCEYMGAGEGRRHLCEPRNFLAATAEIEHGWRGSRMGSFRAMPPAPDAYPVPHA